MPTLYLVPTSLGDPDDISLRALRILREVSAIAAADMSAADTLLERHGIATPVIRCDLTLQALDAGDVALVGSAGTPGIGDWAHEIVVQAIAGGVRVESLPGASAEITALVLSGLPTSAFVYVGALPGDLSAYARERETMIFAAGEPVAALERLAAAFGERRVSVSAHLTAPNQIVYRGTISDALAYFREQPAPGGMMLVVEGAPPEIPEVWDEARVRTVLRERLADGEPLKLAAKAVAEAAGWDRRVVYALGVDEKTK